MNNTLYTRINKYNFNFSKVVIDTSLKISTYTNILMTYRMVCHLYM